MFYDCKHSKRVAVLYIWFCSIYVSQMSYIQSPSYLQKDYLKKLNTLIIS